MQPYLCVCTLVQTSSHVRYGCVFQLYLILVRPERFPTYIYVLTNVKRTRETKPVRRLLRTLGQKRHKKCSIMTLLNCEKQQQCSSCEAQYPRWKICTVFFAAVVDDF